MIFIMALLYTFIIKLRLEEVSIATNYIYISLVSLLLYFND